MSEKFYDWLHGEELTLNNPFREGDPKYWAWEGWMACVKANRIEAPVRITWNADGIRTVNGVPDYAPSQPPLASAMTLRDYFAAKVIVNVLPLSSTNAFAAKEAYKIADAMLKVRESK
jgi:hypothetical protein